MPELTFDDLIKLRNVPSVISGSATPSVTPMANNWMQYIDRWFGQFVESITHLDNIIKNVQGLRSGQGIAPLGNTSPAIKEIEAKMNQFKPNTEPVSQTPAKIISQTNPNVTLVPNGTPIAKVIVTPIIRGELPHGKTAS